MATIVVALLASIAVAAHVTIPSSPPPNASSQLDAAPFGVSFEFAAFPDYMNTVKATAQCLTYLSNALGIGVPVRIGGSSQDRGTYDPNLTVPIKQDVTFSAAGRNNLTFGPSFIALAATLPGDTTIGFNRRLNNLDNTIEAAKVASSMMKNLYAIELGNEPDGFSKSPVAKAQGGWTAADEFANEVKWQTAVCNVINRDNIIQAGNFASITGYNVAGIAPEEQTANSLKYVKDFSGHQYQQSACDGHITNLPKLMNHTIITSFMKRFISEANAANAVKRPYFIGETNSAGCGGGGISPTFGAGLWLIDYMPQATVVGATRVYFHQGVVGSCQYCFWANASMESPWYGAIFVTEALSGADHIAMLDSGNTMYAIFVIYRNDKPVRVVLYNSDYYNTGPRPSHAFSLSGITTETVSSKRLTAGSAEARVRNGDVVTYAGQTFQDGTCICENQVEIEHTAIVNGVGVFTVAASEALLISL